MYFLNCCHINILVDESWWEFTAWTEIAALQKHKKMWILRPSVYYFIILLPLHQVLLEQVSALRGGSWPQVSTHREMFWIWPTAMQPFGLLGNIFTVVKAFLPDCLRDTEYVIFPCLVLYSNGLPEAYLVVWIYLDSQVIVKSASNCVEVVF